MREVLHAAHGPKYTHDRYEKYFLTYDNFLILILKISTIKQLILIAYIYPNILL